MTQAGIQTIGHKEPSKINSEYLSGAWESMSTLLFNALIKFSFQLSTLEPEAHNYSHSVCATNMLYNISMCNMCRRQKRPGICVQR